MIQVLGAGAIGAGLGGLLQRAGHKVTFIARGEHLAAMRDEGLLLRTPRWSERLTVTTATHIEGDGLVLLAVKSQHLDAVLPQLAGRRVLVCMNGLENEGRVAEVASQVHPAMVYVPSQLMLPGTVDLHGSPHVGVVDTDDEELAELLRSAGLDSVATPEIWAWKRAKAITNLCGALQVLGRHFDEVGPLMAEGEQVLAGAGLAHKSVAELLDRVGTFELGLIEGEERVGGSTQQDALRSRPLESAWLNGHFARMGREHGVPTPINAALMKELALSS